MEHKCFSLTSVSVVRTTNLHLSPHWYMILSTLDIKPSWYLCTIDLQLLFIGAHSCTISSTTNHNDYVIRGALNRLSARSRTLILVWTTNLHIFSHLSTLGIKPLLLCFWFYPKCLISLEIVILTYIPLIFPLSSQCGILVAFLYLCPTRVEHLGTLTLVGYMYRTLVSAIDMLDTSVTQSK